MLIIKANTITSNGNIVTSDICIRTTQDTRLGETDPTDQTQMLLWMGYKSWNYDLYQKKGMDAISMPIDGISPFQTSMSKSDAANGVNYEYFNSIFKQHLIDSLDLQESDISIV